MKNTLLILAMAGALTACGGSSSSDSPSGHKPPPTNNPGTPVTGSQTGVLTDGVVAGVSYTTSSGVTGITNAKGEFQYNANDTVTFKIGDVPLNEPVAAQARITPLELSNDINVRNNLLILLQSFDQDGNHDNGIQIAEKTVIALKDKTIDLKQNNNRFLQDATFIQAVTASGTQIVPLETAQENFTKTFFQDIAGVWFLEKEKVLLRITADGQYVLGQAFPKDEVGQSGIETGSLSWNASNGKLSPMITQDTNGEWGFSHPIEGGYTLRYGPHPDTLLLTEGSVSSQQYIFKKVPNVANSVIGSWQTQDHIISLFADNSYFLLYTANYDAVENDCADKGLEYGKYLATATTIKATSAHYDTTGCSGLIDAWDIGELRQNRYDLDTFKLKLEQDKLTVQYENEPTTTFQRIQ